MEPICRFVPTERRMLFLLCADRGPPHALQGRVALILQRN